MTKHKRKSGTQTDIEDLILFAENDQAFETAIKKIKPERISLKELSVKLRDKEFTKKLFKL